MDSRIRTNEKRDIVDFRQTILDLLNSIGPSIITRSAYDTAWLVRLGEMDESLSRPALDWLRANQLPDGSWGALEPRYHHDRMACTLSAMVALATLGGPEDRSRLIRAQSILEHMALGLPADPAGATVGFEMIIPTLLVEAQALGLIDRLDGALDRLTRHREAKITALPKGVINRAVTVAFSTEMVGSDGLHLIDVENLQEANGSVGYSPAATAFFALNICPNNPEALNYLRHYAVGGAVPYVAPIDVFEHAWTLWNLALTGPLDAEMRARCQPSLDFLESEWNPERGIASVAGLTFTDGDATSLTHKVLTHYGREVGLDGVRFYERDNHFLCYPLEANPSTSTNIHVLGALREAGLGVDDPSVQKVLRFLERAQTLGIFWFDKWHASPYYPTSHAIVACNGYCDRLVADALYWMIETQNADGSWGYYLPTAEETAYSLQALIHAKRHGHAVPERTLRRGAIWLAGRVEPPYPPLWIGKCLYSPVLVVRSAIVSALTMAAQEGALD